jgi:tetratricopeptide (TPR) repeat protein
VARLELAQALFDSALVQHKACAASAQRALERYREAESARGVAFAQRYYGRALVFLGRIDEGEELLHEALTAFRALRNRKMIGAVLEDIGLARQHAGDAEAARKRYAEALPRIWRSWSFATATPKKRWR